MLPIPTSSSGIPSLCEILLDSTGGTVVRVSNLPAWEGGQIGSSSSCLGLDLRRPYNHAKAGYAGHIAAHWAEPWKRDGVGEP